MIRKLLAAFFLSLLLSAIGITQLRAEDFITLRIPEAVITKATAAILPLQIDAHSKSIEGDIKIIDISELQLTENHLSCRLHLSGTKLAFLTEIAGHEIKLKVGSVEIAFKTDAVLRFDAKQQILYIKPVVKDVSAGESGPSADIGQALIAVLSGREFPVTMQKLDPLIARAGARTITINTTIANIEAKPQAIELNLRSSVATGQ
jgi:hypothetical protein